MVWLRKTVHMTNGVHLQVCKFDDQEELITTSGQSSCVVSVNAEHNFLAFALSGSPNRLQLAFLNSAPKFVAIQQQQLAASCAYSSVALSTDGNHLLAFCGPAQPYLELWSLSPLQSLLAVDTGPQDHGTAALAHFRCSSTHTSLQQHCCLQDALCPSVPSAAWWLAVSVTSRSRLSALTRCWAKLL